MTGARQAVVVDGLSKSFQLPSEQVHTLKERVLHPFRAHRDQTFDALKDVSFEVGRGEFFGIVGRNGSGKSTLLKCLAGIYRADGGQAWIDGRLSAFVELGVGFNMDLAARDNIRINAVMLGLTSRDARQREEEILDFAGLREFEELKIKNYSSGMLVRLGFAIMAHVDADVLLIDEVLAVGDAAFQQKCYDQFNRIRDEGRTVLFVTHDMGAVERYCDRALLLERGEIVTIGEPARVGQEYLRVNFASESQTPADDAPADELVADAHRITDGRATILETWFEDAAGERVTAVPHGERFTIAVRARFDADVDDPIFGCVLETERHEPVFAGSSHWTVEHSGSFAADEEVTWRLTLENIFAAGRLYATPAVAVLAGAVLWLDRRERFATVVSTSLRDVGAAVDVPYDLDLHRDSPRTVS